MQLATNCYEWFGISSIYLVFSWVCLSANARLLTKVFCWHRLWLMMNPKYDLISMDELGLPLKSTLSICLIISWKYATVSIVYSAVPSLQIERWFSNALTWILLSGKICLSRTKFMLLEWVYAWPFFRISRWRKPFFQVCLLFFFSQSYWVFFTMQRPEPEIKPTFLVKSTWNWSCQCCDWAESFTLNFSNNLCSTIEFLRLIQTVLLSKKIAVFAVLKLNTVVPLFELTCRLWIIPGPTSWSLGT